MPNKQITDLDPLVGGMDNTFNLWAQVDGGGPGSSYAVSWAQLFTAKDAETGTDVVIRAGNATGEAAYGGSVNIYSGYGNNTGGYAGDIKLQGGTGDAAGGRLLFYSGTADYGGDIRLRGSDASDRGGGIYLKAGGGTHQGILRLEIAVGGYLELVNIPESTTYSNNVYVDAITRNLKLRA